MTVIDKKQKKNVMEIQLTEEELERICIALTFYEEILFEENYYFFGKRHGLTKKQFALKYKTPESLEKLSSRMHEITYGSKGEI